MQLKLIRNAPATLFLITANAVVFMLCFLRAGTFEGAAWSTTLFDMGGLFNPYALDGQAYRIITHLFLHGHIFHLLFNLYALFVIGRELEPDIGTKSFVLAYVLAGIGAAIASLYWNLFVLGVGASGAIFGLFGVSLVRNLADSRSNNGHLTGVIINFVLFLVINFILAEALRADVAAHMGGLATGAVLGLTHFLPVSPAKRLAPAIILGALVIFYFLLPRYQVDYFRFFQRVLNTEETVNRRIARGGLSDTDYLQVFDSAVVSWDSAAYELRSLAVVPTKLAADTFRLRRYIHFRKHENLFKSKLIREESYIYRDSIDIALDSLAGIGNLDYPLVMRGDEVAEERPPAPDPPGEVVKVWYDKNWEEIPYPGPYYRIGRRDSLHRWQGPVFDYYADGKIQMKGAYEDNVKHGVFLYYSDHNTYTSAGRYVKDRPVGKWQTFHNNGRLQREEVFDQGVRLKNSWDSAGVQLVKDGFGIIEERNPAGLVVLRGEYRNGLKEGLWFGWHPDGQMHFREEYRDGYLVNGRARTIKGEKYIYDQSVFYPQPDGGHESLQRYLAAESRKVAAEKFRKVKLSFRVTATGELRDFEALETAGHEWDERAKDILRAGPRWNPALLHGHIPSDGYATAEVEFQPNYSEEIN